MGLDLTELRIGGKIHQYLHVVDIPSKIPLAYQILMDKKAETIAKVLRELKSAGYVPKLVISDLEANLIKAIRSVYGNVPIQGVHISLADMVKSKSSEK